MRKTRSRIPAGTASAVFLLVMTPGSAAPQDFDGREAETQVRYLAVNALLGGSAAGLAAVLRGDPLVPSFARGAGGGAIAFAGKLVAAQQGFGRGLLGRQVTSLGSSVTGNAVAGRGTLDRIGLSVGPVRAYVGRKLKGVHWKLDVPALGTVVWFALDGGRPDVRESLSFGTVVFHGDENRGFPGTISHRPSAIPPPGVLAHEQVHVLQWDQSFLMLGGPLEDWMAGRFPRLEGTLRHLEFNVPVMAGVVAMAIWAWDDHSDYPWEREAYLLQLVGSDR